jgi:hypothetical protein
MEAEHWFMSDQHWGNVPNSALIPWLLGVNCLHTAACTILLIINVDSYIFACYLLYLSILFQTGGCIYSKWVHQNSFCCSVLSLCKPLTKNGEEEGMRIHLLLRCLLFICNMWGGAGLVYNVTVSFFPWYQHWKLGNAHWTGANNPWFPIFLVWLWPFARKFWFINA